MDTLFVSPVSPAVLGALNPPVSALPSVARSLASAGAPAFTLQELAQRLLQHNLQTATLEPGTEPVSGRAGLAQDAVISLLASLNPALASAGTAPPTTTAANPEAPQALETSAPPTPTSAVSSAPPVASPQDLPAAQDAFGTSLNPDFAMQTALRFGAGVAVLAAASTAQPSEEGTRLVRDATHVLRMRDLQPHAGGPGPEAFAQPQAATRGALRTYEASPAQTPVPGTSSVDLIA